MEKDGSTIRSVMEPAAHDRLQAIYEREHELLENQAQNGSRVEGTAPYTFVASRPWMDRTGWGDTYKGLDRSVLRNVTAMPARGVDHLLGHGCNDDGSDLLSTREDERKLVKLVAVVRDMIGRWEETARHTPRALLCRLRSTNPNSCYPKPFTLVSLKTSRTKYARLFQRFVVFLF